MRFIARAEPYRGPEYGYDRGPPQHVKVSNYYRVMWFTEEPLVDEWETAWWFRSTRATDEAVNNEWGTEP